MPAPGTAFFLLYPFAGVKKILRKTYADLKFADSMPDSSLAVSQPRTHDSPRLCHFSPHLRPKFKQEKKLKLRVGQGARGLCTRVLVRAYIFFVAGK